MAKVMVSLPDDLLADLDAEAARRGTTRSGLLREFAGASLRRRGEDRAARIEEIMRDASPHGGDVADLVKRHRPAA
jgi:metal-responsive CopG/Arc/MetJ family transcriptional regulator